MCGIAGMIGPSARDAPLLAEMSGCLEHRGPDGSGIWAEGPVSLAHRRLAVLGLGDHGAQPMRSASDRFVIVYNGELYNHLDLRAELTSQGRAPTWRGGSDTETLLAGIEAWGIEGLLPRTVGMFAFAVWDRAEARLTLVRDRLGEKPLSWAIHDGTLLFSSQPAALRRARGFRPTIDPVALAELLRYGQVPGTRTIHREVQQLGPGTLLEVTVDASGRVDGTPRTRAWWSFDTVARHSIARPFAGDDHDMVDAVGAAIDTSVRGQLLADVPLGAFLSGGIDSSLIVATMQRLSPTPVRTFTIGFDEQEHDESPYARAIASHLGTEHTELIVTPAQAQSIIPDLPRIYDEPFADSSQIPTLLVSTLARRSVTVALSGDGGDELFAGYGRYARAERLARVPRPAALAMAATFGLLRDRRRRDAALTTVRGEAALVRRLLSGDPNADRLVLGVDAAATRERFAARWDATQGLGDLTARSMALDTTGYLPDDILHKVDRAAMATSLETRVPLLDHRLVALAWRLPPSTRAKDGTGKWILRELLAREVPRTLFERPKAGFTVPVGSWLRGPLRAWAEDLLAPAAIAREGLLDVSAVRRLWDRHRGGRTDESFALWPILMFRAWSDLQHTARSS